jgi:hypothetical protein
MQVAFLLLAEDEIPTEPIWTVFFASAAEMTLLDTIHPTRPLHRPILSTKHLKIQCQEETLPWTRIQKWTTRAFMFPCALGYA